MYKIDLTKPCHAHFIGIIIIDMVLGLEILRRKPFKLTVDMDISVDRRRSCRRKEGRGPGRGSRPSYCSDDGATAPSSIEILSSGTSVLRSTVLTVPVPPQHLQAPCELKASSSAPGP